MDQARIRPSPEHADDGRLQRTQRGVEAEYIHEVSERHSGHGRTETDPTEEAED